jgi:hypothetical protein
MNIFNQIKEDNSGISLSTLDEITNLAFEQLQETYKYFELEYYEDGVVLKNYSSCTEEETGGFEQGDIENNLTNELLRLISKHL